jgi:hypothetical protein
MTHELSYGLIRGIGTVKLNKGVDIRGWDSQLKSQIKRVGFLTATVDAGDASQVDGNDISTMGSQLVDESIIGMGRQVAHEDRATVLIIVFHEGLITWGTFGTILTDLRIIQHYDENIRETERLGRY